MTTLITFLSGKKTQIGAMLLYLLGLMWSVDLLLHGTSIWLTDAQYTAVGTFVAGLTGAFMRLAIKKVEDSAQKE